MIGNFIGKAFGTVVTFCTLLLSSYTGNDAHFIDLRASEGDGALYFTCYLADAFENDFQEIFSSGIVVPISFEATVRHRRNVVSTNRFTHTVVWSTEIQQWIVYKDYEEEGYATDDFEVLKSLLAGVETVFFINTSMYDMLDIQIVARLPEIEMVSIQRKVDLMLLWKKKEPVGRISINLREAK